MQIIFSSIFFLVILAVPSWAKDKKNNDENIITLKHIKIDSSKPLFTVDLQIQSQKQLSQQSEIIQVLATSFLLQHKEPFNKLLTDVGVFDFLRRQGVQVSDDLSELLFRENFLRPPIQLQLGIFSLKRYSKDFLTPSGLITENGFLIYLDF